MSHDTATAMLVSPETGRTFRRVTVTSLDEVAALHRRHPRFDVGVCFGKPEAFQGDDPQWTYFPALEGSGA